MTHSNKILKNILIKNYRNFKEVKMDFAEPNGEIGSGLTVITGANNAGKTSFLEALTLQPTHHITQSQRHENKLAIIQRMINDQKVTLSAIDQGSQLREDGDHTLLKDLFEPISSRRSWSSRTYPYSSKQIVENTMIAHRGEKEDLLIKGFSSILSLINKNDEDKQNFNNLIKILIPDLCNWTVDTDDSMETYIKYHTNCGKYHRASFLGDGIISLFRICAHLLVPSSKSSLPNKKDILVIDEPELSLHPTSQKRLMKLLIEKSANRQIIICTHSPYFVCWDQIKNGGKLFKLNKCSTNGLYSEAYKIWLCVSS